MKMNFKEKSLAQKVMDKAVDKCKGCKKKK
jgi:hypothetical protein